jgi:hypothetical protein
MDIVMPAEHYRPNGQGQPVLAQGYYCMTCGKTVGMYGHTNCIADTQLVQKLEQLNKR